MTEARRVDPDTNIEAHAQALPPMSNTSSAIWTLDRWAMKEFRKLDVHFRVDWAVTFLWIAANPDRRVTEVAEGLGITGPAASTIIAALSRGLDPWGKPGLGLIELTRASDNHNARVVRLTDQGRLLLAAFRFPQTRAGPGVREE